MIMIFAVLTTAVIYYGVLIVGIFSGAFIYLVGLLLFCIEIMIIAIIIELRFMFIICALNGTDFYTSGRSAINLFKKNTVQVVIINLVNKN